MDKGFLLYVFLGVASSHFFVKQFLYIQYMFEDASSIFCFVKKILYTTCMDKGFLLHVF